MGISRFAGSHEVEGSNPSRSTKLNPNITRINTGYTHTLYDHLLATELVINYWKLPPFNPKG